MRATPRAARGGAAAAWAGPQPAGLRAAGWGRHARGAACERAVLKRTARHPPLPPPARAALNRLRCSGAAAPERAVGPRPPPIAPPMPAPDGAGTPPPRPSPTGRPPTGPPRQRRRSGCGRARGARRAAGAKRAPPPPGGEARAGGRAPHPAVPRRGPRRAANYVYDSVSGPPAGRGACARTNRRPAAVTIPPPARSSAPLVRATPAPAHIVVGASDPRRPYRPPSASSRAGVVRSCGREAPAEAAMQPSAPRAAGAQAAFPGERIQSFAPRGGQQLAAARGAAPWGARRRRGAPRGRRPNPPTPAPPARAAPRRAAPRAPPPLTRRPPPPRRLHPGHRGEAHQARVHHHVPVGGPRAAHPRRRVVRGAAARGRGGARGARRGRRRWKRGAGRTAGAGRGAPSPPATDGQVVAPSPTHPPTHPPTPPAPSTAPPARSLSWSTCGTLASCSACWRPSRRAT
jgi:hypothetical protein